MSWIRIDDGFADHPKIVQAGPIAAIIQIRALCYTARHLTDGVIPIAAIPLLITGLEHIGIDYGGTDEFTTGEQANEMDWPKIMVATGLWDENSSGYKIHDYLKYNPSKHEITKLREIKRKSGQAGGQASAQARAQVLAMPSGSEVLNSPSPSPSPSQTQKDKDKRKIKNLNTIHPLFDLFWKSYPKKQGIGKCQEWFLDNNPDQSLLDKMLLKIEEGKKTEQWRKNKGEYIPMPLTWLNQKRWEDDFKIDVGKESLYA